jgi:hypothetical protein
MRLADAHDAADRLLAVLAYPVGAVLALEPAAEDLAVELLGALDIAGQQLVPMEMAMLRHVRLSPHPGARSEPSDAHRASSHLIERALDICRSRFCLPSADIAECFRRVALIPPQPP